MSIEAVSLSAVPGLGATERVQGTFPTPSLEGTEQPGAAPFASFLEGALQTASASGHQATANAEALARGAADDIHGAMISAKEAEISLKLVGAVRNKLLDAFHELWRTNV